MTISYLGHIAACTCGKWLIHVCDMTHSYVSSECVSTYVHVQIYIHTCVHAYMYAHTSTQMKKTLIYMYIHAHVYTYAHAYMYIHMCMYAHIYIYARVYGTCIFTCVCICIHIYICMCVCIHVHIDTCIVGVSSSVKYNFFKKWFKASLVLSSVIPLCVIFY